MCGINGIISLKKSLYNGQKLIKKMNSSVVHRGPDNSGIWTNNIVFLGHQRLSILDLSELSNQPMTFKNFVLIFNGEIYNFIEIREKLKKEGYTFSTSGDTEVLLKAYDFYGDKIINVIEGMFAFCIYNKSKRTITIFRDSVGQKPIYYLLNNEFFIFSSELTAILKTNLIKKKISKEALAEYMAYGFVSYPNTIIQGIKKITPGSFLKLNLKTKELKQEKRRIFYPKSSKLKKDQVLEKYEKILIDSLKKHFRSDVPIGLYLSSGLDSVSILCGLKKLFPKKKINTISAIFDEKDYDESKDIDKIVTRFNTNHQSFTINKKTIFNSIKKILLEIDEPISDLGLIAVHQLALYSKNKFKVVLSGDGGDELFFGYEPFMKYSLTKIFDLIPKKIINLIKRVLYLIGDNFGYMGLLYKIRLFLKSHQVPDYMKNQVWSGFFDTSQINSVLKYNLNKEDLFSQRKKIYESSQVDRIEKLGLEYKKYFLTESICAHTDKVNMMESIEARSPFLSNNFIKFSNEVPLKFKVDLARGKILMRDYLSKQNLHFISKKKKKGYTIPMANYLLEKNFLQVELNKIIKKEKFSSIFNYSIIKEMFDKHKKKKINYAKQLWNFILINKWMENNKIECL